MGIFREGHEDLGPPPPFVWGEGEPPRRGAPRWLITAAVMLAIVFVGGAIRELYTDWLWFESVGYTSVFTITLGARVALFAGGALLAFLLLMANLWLARAVARRPVIHSAGEADSALAGRLTGLVLLGAALILAFIFGSTASAQWQRVLAFLHAVPFGQSDPIFNQDVGFYVFSLPVQRFVQTWLTTLLILAIAGVMLIYLLTLAFQSNPRSMGAMRTHVALLGVAVLLLLGFGLWLDRYDMLFVQSGAIRGPGYTDVNVRIPVLTLQAVLAVAAAALLALGAFIGSIRLSVLAVVAWALVGLGGSAYAEFVQRFQVVPNELARERPYIQNHIEFTRQAFGLDRVEEVPFPGEDQPSSADIAANPGTIRNVRLWDHDPLKQTYDQIQSIRRYYQFNDVDIDRYRLGDDYRQVMLAARELDPARLTLAGEAPTWVNRRLKFTHGYGLTLSPVNEISGEGLPNLFVKNLPPVTEPPRPELQVTRPEIYFGEKTGDWVIVNTDEPELDYASETETHYSRYDGKGGVILDSLLKRALFAWQMADPNILLTALRNDSRILYLRNVPDRVSHIAPFLLRDHDPYVVVLNGRLVYVQDAYTVSNRYPYAEPYMHRPDPAYNYIRNSVKAVVDAYDGSIDFYISDSSDPIIQTYSRIYPGLFKPMSAMPAELQQHIRYPEDFFSAQADMYQTYHMQDPQIFYNKEDAYARPLEVVLDKEQPMSAYYVIMRLPGLTTPEFMLILPFTPVNKNNTNAWLAGRSDGANYGKLLAFTFPKDKLVYGPRQIESRIDQDPAISAQFALWNQSGSRVLRGNLLFVPIGQSYLYVEPVYLQSASSQLPELKRVVVAAGNRIAMEPSLEESLNRIYGAQVAQPTTPPSGTGGSQPSPSPQPGPGGSPPPNPQLAALARQAQEIYSQAQDRLKAGDWSGYGSSLDDLQAVLQRMVELAQ